METKVISIDGEVREETLKEAAMALRRGEIVAFPTETVYGLGGNALMEEAVKEIFHLKNRPQDNPLTIHLADDRFLDSIVKEIPPEFYLLYEAFCPGPLTLVLERSDQVADFVTGGLDTVGVRFPDQKVCQLLLRLADVPVVAPSANISGKPSATMPQHVLDDFSGRIAYLIDDGETSLGLESTIVDLTGDKLRILRPGVITAEDIEKATGLQVESSRAKEAAPSAKYKHYQASAPIIKVKENDKESLSDLLDKYTGKKVAVFVNENTWSEVKDHINNDKDTVIAFTFSAENPAVSAGHNLFAALRAFAAEDVDLILAESFSEKEAPAYMNRLNQASNAAEASSAEPQNKKILFICTGNTCRSPMAEVIFNQLIKKHKQSNNAVIWSALSAGLNAISGQKASAESVTVLRELGLDLTSHRSQQLTDILLNEVDMVATMTSLQRDILHGLVPSAKEKVKTLSEWAQDISADRAEDIVDPFMQDLSVYRRTRDQLIDLLQALILKL